MRIIVHEEIARAFGPRIRAQVAGVELVVPTDSGWSADPETAEIAYFSNHFFRADLNTSVLATFVELQGLRWLHTCQTGTDHPLYARALSRGIEVTSSPGAFSPAVAQYVIAMMLRVIKRLDVLDAAQREGRWAPQRADELTDKTVGIVGLGQIGQEIARLAKAFRMNVLGHRRGSDKPDDVDELVTLPELLARSRFVVVAIPLTAATRHLIDAAQLARVDPKTWLINVSRGGVVDEAALIAALERGALGGACLDVFEVEPLPPASPLWRMPNTIITPHNAPGGSPLCIQRATDIFFTHLDGYGRSHDGSRRSP